MIEADFDAVELYRLMDAQRMNPESVRNVELRSHDRVGIDTSTGGFASPKRLFGPKPAAADGAGSGNARRSGGGELVRGGSRPVGSGLLLLPRRASTVVANNKGECDATD
jgi:hypothetical protein